jgi:hypothetical protein
MIGFNLPTNFIDDPEALPKRTKAKLKRVPVVESEDNRIRQSLTSEFETMANKSLYEFSALTTANIRTGPEVNVRDNGFELEPALINMVQASQFYGNAHEDASAHLHVTPIFKDKNRMHKRIMCAPGNSRTHKLTNYISIITVLIT